MKPYWPKKRLVLGKIRGDSDSSPTYVECEYFGESSIFKVTQELAVKSRHELLGVLIL